MKSCGPCTMCCKSMGILEAEDSTGSWCSYCAVGKGCTRYDTRPRECADFRCLWLQDEQLGPHWRPDIAGFVLAPDPARGRLVIHLNAAAPNDWRRPEYREGIRRMAQDMDQVVVELRGRFTPLQDETLEA